jgi:hypothetical protein
MSISISEQKIVAFASGGVCAFPECGENLTSFEGSPNGTIVGELAHIVAEQRQGPRGRVEMSDDDRNKAANLLLLCPKHHTIIDRNPHVYSVHVLRQIKADHERRIATAMEKNVLPPSTNLIAERVHSTMLRLSQLPRYVYSAESDYTERQKDEVRALILFERVSRDELLPFILRENRLFSFQNLADLDNPFVKVANPVGALRIPIKDFCSEPEGRRRLVSLLNSAIAKHCGRRKVLFDKQHRRFYFVPVEKGTERSETYSTLTGRSDTRNVVWNPKKRSTGEGRPYWLHLAANLAFHQLGPNQWCLSIRPERHVTRDGETPYNPKYVGRKVTSLKARMFNDAYLAEVHFWRDFLSNGKPRFILGFGRQSVIVETELLSLEIAWEGIPLDTKAFSNQVFEEDLFTLGELHSASGDPSDDEENEDDFEDENI